MCLKGDRITGNRINRRVRMAPGTGTEYYQDAVGSGPGSYTVPWQDPVHPTEHGNGSGVSGQCPDVCKNNIVMKQGKTTAKRELSNPQTLKAVITMTTIDLS